MSLNMFYTLFSLILFDVFLGASSYELQYKITHRNKCLESDLILRYFLKISLKQCVQECAVRTVCQSINYRRQHLLCELYLEADGIFIENSARTGACVFVRKSSIDKQMPKTCSCEYMETCDVESMTCVRRECHKLMVNNGEVDGNLNALGSNVNFVCKDKYSTRTTNYGGNWKHATCEQTGQWSNIPSCIIECPKLTLSEGVIIGDLRIPGSEVTFTCNDSYTEVENRTSATCYHTGQWSYVPHCVKATCSTTPRSFFKKRYDNIALNKQVTLSDVLYGKEGYIMVDGNLSPNYPNCSHTSRDRPSFAVVDLGQSYTIYALYIVNRADCCGFRLNNVSITIGDSVDTLQLYVFHEPAIGSNCTFVLAQPCRGRYLKIVNDDMEPLTICELEVYGD